jgi:hypothetical protein
MKERAGFDPIEIALCPQKGLPIERAVPRSDGRGSGFWHVRSELRGR